MCYKSENARRSVRLSQSTSSKPSKVFTMHPWKILILYAVGITQGCLALTIPNPSPTNTRLNVANSAQSRARSTSFEQAAKPTLLARQETSANATDPDETILVTTSGESTWSQTFIETSLSEFATVTAPTTITTTDASGNVALGIVFAGGLAWLGIPAPLPPIDPPLEAPDGTAEPPSTEEPSTTSLEPTTSTSLSSTSSSPPRKTQTAVRQFAHSSAQILRDAIKSIGIVPNNVKACAPGPTAAVDRDQALTKLLDFCEDQDSKVIDESAGNQQEFNMGGGTSLQASLRINEACSGLPVNGNNETCSSAMRQAIDDCDTDSSQKHGGSVSDGCTIYSVKVAENEGTDLSCHGPSSPDTGITRDSAISNIKDFCKMNR